MAIEKLAGTLSVLQETTKTTGSLSKGEGDISTQAIYNFRLDGKPVQFKPLDAISITEGDDIVVAGHAKGIFMARALYNKTTGTVYYLHTYTFIIAGIVFIIVGIALLLAIIGILPLGLGIYLYLEGTKNKKAYELIQNL